jgi:nucleoside-diphosphate-sugar epimerase
MTGISRVHAGKPDIRHLDRWFAPTIRLRTEGSDHLLAAADAAGVFNIVDDEPDPASEWLPYLAACAGAKPPMRVPKWLARLLAGEVAVTMMTHGRGFSNAKAKRELGWELRYPSWRQGFREMLA